MEDSNSSKPVMVTSSLNFKVTTPSFYNQPKKFASVAPPRPKSQTPPSAPSPTPVGTGVIGRVGDLPPPPPLLCDGMCIIYAIFLTILSYIHSVSSPPPSHLLLLLMLEHAELHSWVYEKKQNTLAVWCCGFNELSLRHYITVLNFLPHEHFCQILR